VIVGMMAYNIQMPAVGEGAFDAIVLSTYRADSERYDSS